MIRFTRADLQAFALATGDRNPLHLSDEFARHTPFGEQVVFGALGVLRALAHLDDDRTPSRLQARFMRPLFVGRDYQVVVNPGTERTSVASIMDHGERATSLVVTWGPAETPHDPVDFEGPARPMVARAAVVDAASVAGSAPTALRYACDPPGIRHVAGVPGGWSDSELAAVACASYVAGMEVPGQQALLLDFDIRFFARLETTSFDTVIERITWDERFSLVTLDLTLQDQGRVFATARIHATQRPSATVTDIELAASRLPANESTFEGRTAVVIGGSRGVGAVLAAQASLSGAAVTVTFERSDAQAAALVNDLTIAGGKATAMKGDARDPEFAATVADSVATGLDLLICSAWPPFVKLGHASSAIDPLIDHVTSGVAMVATPLLALLPLMNGQGDVVFLSSELVQRPDPNYWQYSTGKAATEAMVRSLAALHPQVTFHLARPTLLATDYAQPVGGPKPVPPSEAGRTILEHCGTGRGGVHVIEFEPVS